uniref:PB1 domain-containing protein n=1 Tax=Kalanchoe fedtschenkoi TaxID=63787 RepID=A0A7N1A5B0_KALFE
MENYSYSSYPDSQNSSPRSRDIDCENQSWDEPVSNYKVKFMCSYGGKIQPRPHDNQLSYIGGETKILSVDRNVKFAVFIGKLSSLCDSEVCFKYQLPGEDLDALISVTNDEDLEHMMLEYDRLYRASAKPARLRLFLFMVNTQTSRASFDSGSPKSDQQWFVEALNSAPTIPVESSVPVVVGTGANPDFLFGLDKGAQPVVMSKLPDAVTPPAVVTVPAVAVVPAESQVRVGEQVVVGDPVLSQAEIQRQINELQRMQISGQEQVVYQQKSDGSDGLRAYVGGGDYYATQRVAENVVQAPQGVPMQMPVYWQDQSQMTAGGYQVTSGGTVPEQQVYIIPTSGGMYQASANYNKQMAGQVGHAQAQAFYGTQRMVPDGYREQQVYSGVPSLGAQTIQQPTIGVYSEGMGGRQPTEGGYAVAYDGTGRQVYYTAAGGGGQPTYQVVSAAAAAPVAQVGTMNQEGKMAVPKPN